MSLEMGSANSMHNNGLYNDKFIIKRNVMNTLNIKFQKNCNNLINFRETVHY